MQASVVSVVGFFVIVVLLGILLHRTFSKTNIYKKKVKDKGCIAGFLYINTLILLLYVLLVIILGVIKLIQ